MSPSYYCAWTTCRFLSRFYFGWNVYHPEHVPAAGPAILACNHASFFDPFLVGAGVERPIYYLARQTVFVGPLGPMLRSWNAVPVDRDGGGPRGMMQIIDRLHAGNAIVLFPEGTRTRTGQLQPARAGIGLIVIKSEAPVVPIRVFGTYEAWNRHMKLPRPFHRIAVKYGQPMDFAALRAEAKVCPKERLRAIYQQVADEIMAAIARLEPKEDHAQATAS